MADNLPEPKSRKESYLAKAAGMSVTIPEEPESREEQYLAAIAEGGGGGGGTTYTAGENIQISPQNVISATDTTYSDFTGATSGEAGSGGLVPAPTTSDVNNFLKGDGTWSAAVLPTQMNTRLGGLTLLTISQTDYDNLQTYDQNTLYIITGA